MTPIGFDTRSGALLIVGNDVYPPRTLTASLDGQGMVKIISIAGRVEQYIPWSQVSNLAGDGFTTADALRAYLVGEFGKSAPVGETYGSAIVAGDDLAIGTPVAVSRASRQLLPARADTYVLSFVAGLAAEETAQGFSTTPARGAVTLPDWTEQTGEAALHVGVPYFLAPEGGLTISPFGGAGLASVRVGTALSPTTLGVAPTDPILF